jgi:hypothetical protein
MKLLLGVLLAIGLVGCTDKHLVSLDVGPEGRADCTLTAGPAGGDVGCRLEGPAKWESYPMEQPQEPELVDPFDEP